MRLFDFDHAILRAHSGPSPTFEDVLAKPRGYATALADAGVSVEMLTPLEDYTDSVFVEDPALTFPEGAILLRHSSNLPRHVNERRLTAVAS